MDNTFVFHNPSTVAEAVALLEQYQGKAKVIAGGTDLVPKYKAGVIHPEHLINIKSIQSLNYVTFDETAGLRIGAAAALHDLERETVIQGRYPMLYQGIHSMASTQIRNAGTLVGNICNAIPSADTAPALLALKATVKITGAAGTREVPVEEFFTGVCRTVVGETEMVTEVVVPVPDDGVVMNYYKNTVRRGLDLAMVGVAVYINAKEGVCQEIRIGLGAVAATPRRAFNAEKLLLGKKLTAELIEEAAAVASREDCAPITDIRATKEYRQELVRLSVRDGICACM